MMIYRVKGIKPDGSVQINVLQSAYSPDQAIRRVQKSCILQWETIALLKWEAEEQDSAPTK